jgi:hypothetical protein
MSSARNTVLDEENDNSCKLQVVSLSRLERSIKAKPKQTGWAARGCAVRWQAVV